MVLQKDTIKESPILDITLEYSLENYLEKIQGKGRCEIYKEYIQIIPEFEAPILFTYRDILSVNHKDYIIVLKLSSMEELFLYKLGYHYEPCINLIIKNRNEMLIKDMLFNERLHRKGVKAEYRYSKSGKEKEKKGVCELKFYETAMIFTTDKGEINRISYCFINSVREDDYSLHIKTSFQEEYIFNKMGREFNSVKKLLSDLINQRSLDTQHYLKEKFPDLNSLIIRKAANLLKDGLAVNINDLAQISPSLKFELENYLIPANIKEEYDFLMNMSQKTKVCIGLKRSLLGEVSGDYIWFLTPIYHINKSQPGNVVAMEAANIGETEGRATYLFQMTSWEKYNSFHNIEELHNTADSFIENFNKCMLTINFRREPIYLSEEIMAQPKYSKYRYAIENLSELQFLRQHFIGRVFHKSFEQWKEDFIKIISKGFIG
jgi:hypothetical protein